MTTITLTDAAIGHGRAAAVPPLSVTIAPGTPTAIAVETAERPLLVSMLIGGRMRPDSGAVLIDGVDDASALRRATALVDTPFAAEPAAGIALGTIVAEEFSFARRSTSRRAVRAFLADHGLTDFERVEIGLLPPEARVRILAELALLREGVTAIVLTSPERHGGDAATWFDYLCSVAERGVTVAIVTDAATRDRLTARAAAASTESTAS